MLNSTQAFLKTYKFHIMFFMYSETYLTHTHLKV